MPGGDRTGPAGAGPRTGRGAGFCAGFASAGWTRNGGGSGRGRGAGWGRGAGRRSRWGAQAAPHDDVPLGEAIAWLQEQLASIQRRLDMRSGRETR